jgi:hypothetical protein
MDPLDRLAEPAADLLARVDEVLAEAGAPDGHRIWPLLRRLGALPGDVLTAVRALQAAPIEAAAARLRSRSGGYDDAAGALIPIGWTGAGGEAYERMREALRAHLAGGPDSLAGRLDATASYFEAVAGWAAATRLALAHTLADLLTSAEAVAVVTGGIGGVPGGPGGPNGPPGAAGPAGPAAEIGARVLAVGVDVADRAEELTRRWDARLAPVTFRPPYGVAARLDGVTRIAL